MTVSSCVKKCKVYLNIFYFEMFRQENIKHIENGWILCSKGETKELTFKTIFQVILPHFEIKRESPICITGGMQEFLLNPPSRLFGSYKKIKLRGTQRKGRYSPLNLVGQDSKKSVYSTIKSLLQNTVPQGLKSSILNPTSYRSTGVSP